MSRCLPILMLVILLVASASVSADAKRSKLLNSVKSRNPKGEKDPVLVSLYQMEDGIVAVDNHPDSLFSLKIPCRRCVNVGRDPQTLAIDADGIVVQVLTVPLSDFTKLGPNESAEAILNAHRNYELSYLGKSLRVDPKSLVFGYPSLDFKAKALIWRMSFPPGTGKFFGQMYVTKKMSDWVLVLTGTLRAQSDSATTEKLLGSALRSLYVSKTPLGPPLNFVKSHDAYLCRESFDLPPAELDRLPERLKDPQTKGEACFKVGSYDCSMPPRDQVKKYGDPLCERVKARYAWSACAFRVYHCAAGENKGKEPGAGIVCPEVQGDPEATPLLACVSRDPNLEDDGMPKIREVPQLPEAFFPKEGP